MTRRQARWLAGTGLALALLPGVAQAQGKEAFPEIPKTHWARESVLKLAYRGIFTGYPDETFRGSRAVTRYEMAVGLQRLNAEAERYGAFRLVLPRGPQGPAGPAGPPGPPGPDAPQAEWTRILSETSGLRQDVTGLRDSFAGLRDQLRTLRGSLNELSEQTQPLDRRVERLHRNRHRILLERAR